ncbi:MAG: TA system VapC family ribonuclease toxin [Bryobacteraceae bacterium]|jgi:toxin-antitoxin system PIN domain toxin
MTSLSFPDVNVWLAVLLADHIHRAPARKWWESDVSAIIAFSRFTQISVLRLLTTAAAMNGKPLTMSAAWHAYDRLFEDDRVALLPEPDSLDPAFRKLSRSRVASPKVWADAYIVAFAARSNGTLVTFDRALANREADCLLLN